jgi:hypothetical protein
MLDQNTTTLTTNLASQIPGQTLDKLLALPEIQTTPQSNPAQVTCMIAPDKILSEKASEQSRGISGTIAQASSLEIPMHHQRHPNFPIPNFFTLDTFSYPQSKPR